MNSPLDFNCEIAQERCEPASHARTSQARRYVTGTTEYCASSGALVSMTFRIVNQYFWDTYDSDVAFL